MTIKHVARYAFAHDLIDDLRPQFFDHLTDDQFETLLHLEDYETIEYLVLDHEQVLVLDSLNGDVYDQYQTVAAFTGAIWYAITGD